MSSKITHSKCLTVGKEFAITQRKCDLANIMQYSGKLRAECGSLSSDVKWRLNVMIIAVGRGAGGERPLSILKILTKKVVFLFLSNKNKFHHFWPLLEKFWKNPLEPPLGKNTSDAHGDDVIRTKVCYCRFSVAKTYKIQGQNFLLKFVHHCMIGY